MSNPGKFANLSTDQLLKRYLVLKKYGDYPGDSVVKQAYAPLKEHMEARASGAEMSRRMDILYKNLVKEQAMTQEDIELYASGSRGDAYFMLKKYGDHPGYVSVKNAYEPLKTYVEDHLVDAEMRNGMRALYKVLKDKDAMTNEDIEVLDSSEDI